MPECTHCPDPANPSPEFHPGGTPTHTYPGEFPPGVRIPEDDDEEDDTPLAHDYGGEG